MRVKCAKVQTPILWNGAPLICSKCLCMLGPSPRQCVMLASLFGGQLFAVAHIFICHDKRT